jgi:membrane-associated phospholipid phosphatase
VCIALSRATDHSAGWFAAGLAGAGLDQGRRGRWLAATARIAGVELAVRAVKRGPVRQRPQLAGLPPLAPVTSPNSFPSSHTAAATAAVRAFDGLLPRPALRSLLALTAFSRLYLGVHYPSDVLAGALLGAA